MAKLAAAYGRLGALARARRECENRRLAEALRAWNGTGGGGNEALPVERVLEAVVAPLARQTPDGGGPLSAPLPYARRGWRGLAVLYICPLRALLNNLEPRIHRYASLAGRTAALWHGDVGGAARRRLLRGPPDVLLTTPEALEAS